MKVEATTEYLYPDAVITCLEPKLVGAAPRSLVNPEVVIEVLSPTTEAKDRGAKWLAYQTISTLTDYVMIASERRSLEHYQRAADGSWTFRTLVHGTCKLANGAELDLDAVYALTPLAR